MRMERNKGESQTNRRAAAAWVAAWTNFQWQLKLEGSGGDGRCWIQALPGSAAESQRSGSAVAPFWGRGGLYSAALQRAEGTGWVLGPGWSRAVDGLYWGGSAGPVTVAATGADPSVSALKRLLRALGGS